MVHYIIDESDPKESGLEAPYIKLYSLATPNGQKVSILLELLGLDYHVRKIDIMRGECKEDWYLQFNPNGRIPSLTDVSANGKVTHVNESAAIMMYLCDKYDKDRKYSYEYGTDLYYEQLEWVFFQMAGLGPMKGQYHHFAYFAPEKIPYAIERYKKETIRLFSVLEERLARNKTGYLVGDHLSIADLCSWPWVNSGRFEEIDNFPRLSQWLKNIGEIEAVKRGSKIPE
ncbi:hypothetical protein KL930_004909 [Ogataea haglerorum]|uniref:Glutathione S-transferase n=1 Tax=Ogataea haglerorum TaxID=1937702 RepID=A0AAN6I1P6_9ASCO|nr:uncharacterized protein KL911_004970 [Ogataea haglerorum]KAG7692276.1 hypothetical protein KL915_004707 [Ogataea haglerorum]KAG7699800.1 hypothetical protein KL951_001517 [Ogataea haglerorum]KAG7703076.1 hypothetical protein KL914_004857 [Ogataea haglerorum]KAG7703200.1 hypothetical protein KL950_004834 [Ogataea haglerorum]KAG7714801.1 hypothetical protein KL949_004637 [Ogataea haglerorum]